MPQHTSFTALIIDAGPDGRRQKPAEFRELSDASALPAPGGEVVVEVSYSSLNYKDGLAVTGKGKILRQLPIVPGIDLAGTVVAAGNDAGGHLQVGDEVIVTGWGVGEQTSGGYAGCARVQADWCVRLPAGLDARQAMGIGTAGLTAMLCVLALEDHGVAPGKGREVVVTGAAGGVGSVAVALLAKLGHRVVASTGRVEEEREYLRGLGAADLLARDVLAKPSGKPLDSERWAGGVDAVGGETLAAVLRQTRTHGSVAACGLAGGAHLPTTVHPFILRGVNLLGIDSNTCPRPRREQAWQRLATDLDRAKLERMIEVIALRDVPRYAEEILAGKVRGRVVVDVQA
ncbi:MAG: oxidoreductase [Verrucomicrobia bacterium]|nr:oxidoreductase [Verrucomicrobiota bacterium]